jgi:hypothetical protein
MANRDFFRRLGLADEVAAPTLAKLRQPKTLRRLLLALGHTREHRRELGKGRIDRGLLRAGSVRARVMAVLATDTSG